MFLKVLAPIFTPMKALGSAAVRSSTWFELLKGAFIALTAPIGLTVSIIISLLASFTIAYTKSESFRKVIAKIKDALFNAVEGIKEFLTTNPQILAFIDSVKKGFNSLKDNVSKAIKAVVNFAIEKFSQIKSFWDSEGQQLLEA